MTARIELAGPSPRPASKIALLLGLYFAQGLPFGFQSKALPVYLRERGVSLAAIGLLGLLTLPWIGKALWAPLVDRYGSERFGRRRSWIVPMQAGLMVCCAAAAFVPPEGALPVLLGLVFLMNLFAATQDIAVDGLAVDILRGGELGPGNAAQVVGYKLGMLTGGGLLLWASAVVGWRGLFGLMALLVGLVLGVSLLYREPSSLTALRGSRRSLREVMAAVLALVRQPGTSRVLVLVATYKMGESMASAMLTPFLVDIGFTRSQIGLWLGTYGMVASLAGSVLGGLLAAKMPPLRAVGWTAVLRVLPLVGVWALSVARPGPSAVIAVSCAEHFFGGALTTAMFAFMMSRVDPRIGATHYTLLASVEVLGKGLTGLTSGGIAQAVGYPGVFAIAVLLSVGFLALLSWARVDARGAPARHVSP